MSLSYRPISHSRRLTASESQVLDDALPAKIRPEMRDIALCLYEALALQDRRAGQETPQPCWIGVLQHIASAVAAQIEHLAREKGGAPIYISKGIAIRLSARDHDLCKEYRGDNIPQLARKYDLTEVRVRQIVALWQQEQFARRQPRLPGMG